MTSGLRTVIYPVDDLPAARDLYAALLGVPPYVDEPYYVGFRLDAQEVGLDPSGHARGLTGPIGYWHVESVEAAVAELTARGARVTDGPRDVGGGKLVASMSDPAGNVFGLLQMP